MPDRRRERLEVWPIMTTEYPIGARGRVARNTIHSSAVTIMPRKTLSLQRGEQVELFAS